MFLILIILLISLMILKNKRDKRDKRIRMILKKYTMLGDAHNGVHNRSKKRKI
jgi:hypothetical protein